MAVSNKNGHFGLAQAVFCRFSAFLLKNGRFWHLSAPKMMLFGAKTMSFPPKTIPFRAKTVPFRLGTTLFWRQTVSFGAGMRLFWRGMRLFGPGVVTVRRAMRLFGGGTRLFWAAAGAGVIDASADRFAQVAGESWEGFVRFPLRMGLLEQSGRDWARGVSRHEFHELARIDTADEPLSPALSSPEEEREKSK